MIESISPSKAVASLREAADGLLATPFKDSEFASCKLSLSSSFTGETSLHKPEDNVLVTIEDQQEFACKLSLSS